MILDGIKLALFDMDGTIYLGSRPLEGAIDTLNKLDALGVDVVFLTNNTTKDKALYCQKLARMGYKATDEQVISSTVATAEYITKHCKDMSFYPIGSEAFVIELKRFGVKCAGAEEADALLLSFDTTLTYEKLHNAHNMLEGGKKYFATHPDLVCPTEDGSMPDTGAFIKLLEASTGRLPDAIFGKPYAPMAEAVERRYSYKKSEILMVGDRLYTDIAFGINNGYRTVTVLSGETTAEMAKASPIKADYTVADIRALLQ